MSNTSKIFVRGLWGYEGREEFVYKRYDKVAIDIKVALNNPFEHPFVTYVFGEDNYNFLIDLGCDCRLIDKNPMIWGHKGGGTHQYTHKTKIFQVATQEFDEVVFLDWDCMAAKPIPDNFWEVLRQKQDMQAILRGYKKKVCKWRKIDRGQRPCASFVYLRGKDAANTMWEIQNEGRKNMSLSEEQVMAKYSDNLLGGWQGRKAYWDNFEPDFFILSKGEVPFQPHKEALYQKNWCFTHMNKYNIKPGIEIINKFTNKQEIKKHMKEFLATKLTQRIY